VRVWAVNQRLTGRRKPPLFWGVLASQSGAGPRRILFAACPYSACGCAFPDQIATCGFLAGRARRHRSSRSGVRHRGLRQAGEEGCVRPPAHHHGDDAHDHHHDAGQAQGRQLHGALLRQTRRPAHATSRRSVRCTRRSSWPGSLAGNALLEFPATIWATTSICSTTAPPSSGSTSRPAEQIWKRHMGTCKGCGLSASSPALDVAHRSSSSRSCH